MSVCFCLRSQGPFVGVLRVYPKNLAERLRRFPLRIYSELHWMMLEALQNFMGTDQGTSPVPTTSDRLQTFGRPSGFPMGVDQYSVRPQNDHVVKVVSFDNLL